MKKIFYIGIILIIAWYFLYKTEAGSKIRLNFMSMFNIKTNAVKRSGVVSVIKNKEIVTN